MRIGQYPFVNGVGPRISRGEYGYTLLELLLIIVIMGVLATSAIPVINQSVQARQGASRDEVVRLFEFARGRAMASGVPAGVLVDTNENTLTLVTLSQGGDVVDIVDPIDGGVKFSNLDNEYAGVAINSFVNGDGSSGDGAVWFDFRSEPHTRDGISGDFDSVFIQNATVTLSTGTLIVIHSYSGLVEERQ